ncbi:DUF4430 domain-containing protein [Caldalkalibacillus horti]|uniref:Transcobalamin-like C-terminal domain-containing protein n=1 Tax=Caldalkalibacillus horti TaxID=77523 RepID=A0ABT9VZQ6_9BACI|nr:DUF4430 domain-containing protein [Bacillus horti]MDQ0166479.1 hypothetical protein [Bacillus horti]
MKKKSLIGLAATLLILLVISYFMGSQDHVVPLESANEQKESAQPGKQTGAGNTDMDEEESLPNDEEQLEPQDEMEGAELNGGAGQQLQEISDAPTDSERDETASESAGHEAINQESVNQDHTTQESANQANGNQDHTAQERSSTQKADAPELAQTPEEPADHQEEDRGGEKDQYLTDPVPEGKPKPVEWQDVTVDKGTAYTATLSVTALTILNNLNLFNEDKLEVLPEDGVIFEEQTVTFYEGESVFDVLLREMQEHKIHMEFVMTPIYNSHYIEGINNIYEFDCGELSGWMYKVNDWFPNYGASRYQLEPGDDIEWVYTCDLGRDIGGYGAANGG